MCVSRVLPCVLFSVFHKCTSAWCCEELALFVTDVYSSVQGVGARTLPCMCRTICLWPVVYII